MPIIFITGHGDVATTVKAMKAGAVEFLTKPFRDDTVLNAIRDAITRSHRLLSSAEELRRLRERYESLTRRETEVVALVISGHLNKQVAAELVISEITVKAHRGNVMRKMKANSFAELVGMASKLRIAPNPILRIWSRSARLDGSTRNPPATARFVPADTKVSPLP
jgi:FixJ family two-component response regulator